MKKMLLLIASVVLAISSSFAQSVQLTPTVIASAGAYSETENISLSWTLGEVAVSTVEQNNLVLSQGFQQGFLKDVGFKLEPIEWQIIAYPNPVKDILNIQFDVKEPSDFFIEIQDVSGRLLSQKEYKSIYPGDVVPAEMSSYNPGVYFFRISTTNREQVRVISIRKL